MVELNNKSLSNLRLKQFTAGGSDNAAGKKIPQFYSAVISKKMTVTSGDNSWFIKFHNGPKILPPTDG